MLNNIFQLNETAHLILEFNPASRMWELFKKYPEKVLLGSHKSWLVMLLAMSRKEEALG